jgi:hypothetical protein
MPALLSTLLLVAGAISVGRAAPFELFVNCDTGSDAGDGSQAHPFLTPSHARDVLRAQSSLSDGASSSLCVMHAVHVHVHVRRVFFWPWCASALGRVVVWVGMAWVRREGGRHVGVGAWEDARLAPVWRRRAPS